MRKRSARVIGCLPLYHTALGPGLQNGEVLGHARGVIAIGHIATGWLALGGWAQGGSRINEPHGVNRSPGGY